MKGWLGARLLACGLGLTAIAITTKNVTLPAMTTANTITRPRKVGGRGFGCPSFSAACGSEMPRRDQAHGRRGDAAVGRWSDAQGLASRGPERESHTATAGRVCSQGALEAVADHVSAHLRSGLDAPLPGTHDY